MVCCPSGTTNYNAISYLQLIALFFKKTRLANQVNPNPVTATNSKIATAETIAKSMRGI